MQTAQNENLHKEPTRRKIIVKVRFIELESHHNYLENEIGYEKNYYIHFKYATFQGICGAISFLVLEATCAERQKL